MRIDAETAQWAREEARASGLPHNEARPVFTEIVTYVVTERAVSRIAQGWITRSDRAAWAQLRTDVLDELARSEAFTAALDELWPILTPATLLGPLYASPDRLRAAGADPALWRADGDAWTVPDVPLLDELVDLLGRDKAAVDAEERAARQERQAESEYAAGVMEILTLDREELDEDVGVTVDDLIHDARLAERFEERDTRELAERAAADRDWTYRHVVVDEAQELSEMDWRVLMRRCPSRSFTVVGDLAQRRSPAGARSWGAMLEPYVPGRWAYRSLTVNYRTPAEIMAVAAAVLAEFAPDVRPPDSVRASGVQPWSRQVTDDELPAAIEAFVRDEAGREGTSVVIGTGGVAPSATKGLEFDAVLVVDPDRILAEGPQGAADLYVALTRATQRLGVLHREPLPDGPSAHVSDLGRPGDPDRSRAGRPQVVSWAVAVAAAARMCRMLASAAASASRASTASTTARSSAAASAGRPGAESDVARSSRTRAWSPASVCWSGPLADPSMSTS